MAGRLSGKRVLITGTGGGQGAAAQRLFVAEGARVAGCDVKPGTAEAVAAEIGPGAFGRTVDLADYDACAAWVEWGAKTLGCVDIFYNNASGTAFNWLPEIPLDEWSFVLRNELDIAFHATRAAWPHLVASGAVTGNACILNTCSISAMVAIGGVGQSAHTAAKGALLSLTRQLASEGASHGIRAVAISPGFVDSPATAANVPEEARAYMLKLQMIKRAGTPEDVAYLALYLASDEASWVTGANYVIDGGWTAWAG